MKLFASFLTVAASECFSNWGDSTTGCFPEEVTWACSATGFTMTGSLSALYENSHLLTAAQKAGPVTVKDTHQLTVDSALAKEFEFDDNGDISFELTWADLGANPVYVSDTTQIRFSATISPAEPIVASSKYIAGISRYFQSFSATNG